MRYLSLLIFLIANTINVNGQSAEELVKWNVSIVKAAQTNEYIVTATAKIETGWHLFGQKPGDEFLIPTHFEFEGEKVELIRVDEVGTLKTEEMKGVGTIHYYEKEVSFKALVRSIDNNIKGFIEFQICNATMCLPPTEQNFSFTVN